MNLSSNFKLKFLLICLPAAAWMAVQFFLPKNVYTFRTWEALFLPGAKVTPFYPSSKLQMLETGDLAGYSKHGIPKNVLFQTDRWGYRNSLPDCDNPEVIVIGDSMAAGGSLSQEDTISAQLSRTMGKCVRSFGGGNVNRALSVAFGTLGLRPKEVILIQSERGAGTLKPFLDPSTATSHPFFENNTIRLLLIGFFELRKNMYWNFRGAHGVYEAIRKTIAHEKLTSPEYPRIIPKMLFLPGEWDRVLDQSAMEKDREQLSTFAENLAKVSSRLTVVFVPNKSSVYSGPFQIRDPDFYQRYSAVMRGVNFRLIDLFQPFKEDFSKGILNHHLDDTHWNPQGVQRLVKILESNAHP